MRNVLLFVCNSNAMWHVEHSLYLSTGYSLWRRISIWSASVQWRDSTLERFKYFAYTWYKTLEIKETVGFIPSKSSRGNTHTHISMPCIKRNVRMIYSSACEGAATYCYTIKSTGYSLWRTFCYILIWSAPVQRLDLSLSPFRLWWMGGRWLDSTSFTQ